VTELVFEVTQESDGGYSAADREHLHRRRLLGGATSIDPDPTGFACTL